MAQMPRGEPRSVPDPEGEQYDEMLRQERLRRQIAETDFSGGSEYFSSNIQPDGPLARVNRGLDMSRPRTPRDALFCAIPSTVSPAQIAERRQAIERAFFMADHPLAGAAYGLASLANGSSQARDQALAAGGTIDTLMMSAAPFGVSPRGRPTPPPRASSLPEGLERGGIRSAQPNARGQAPGVSATLKVPMLGTGTPADKRQSPPGWQGHGRDFNEARGHLLGNQLGGPGDKPWNLVTLTQKPANSPQMRDFENELARRVRAGEVVEYSAKPLYESGILPPSAVLLTATGSRGRPVARLVRNPAGLPK